MVASPGTTRPRSAAKRGRPPDPALTERRRGQIVRAAAACFAREGYRCTDIKEIADRLKLGKGTIYRYFPSKRDLFQAAVDGVMVGMFAAIDAAVARATDPLDRIVLAIRGYLRFFHEHPEYVELLIQERAEFRDRKKPTYFRYREANMGRWRDLYAGLIRDGRVRDVPIDRITDVVGDLIYGTMFTNYMAGRAKNLVEQADDVVDMLFNGLLTPGEQQQRTRTPMPPETTP